MPKNTAPASSPGKKRHPGEDVPAARTCPDGRDHVGMRLDGQDAVREEARLRAHLLLSEGHRQGQDRRMWTIDVVDEAGAYVLSISLGDAVSA